MINDMLALAAVAHSGQRDKAGVPYIFHIMAVTEYTRQAYGHEDEDLLCIAAGHDLLEDTDVDYQFLVEHFGKRVADGILCLSKPSGLLNKYWYEEYVERLLSNVDAMRVKLKGDLRHNMQADRILIDENTEKRMNKYAALEQRIEEKLNEAGLS